MRGPGGPPYRPPDLSSQLADTTLGSGKEVRVVDEFGDGLRSVARRFTDLRCGREEMTGPIQTREPS